MPHVHLPLPWYQKAAAFGLMGCPYSLPHRKACPQGRGMMQGSGGGIETRKGGRREWKPEGPPPPWHLCVPRPRGQMERPPSPCLCPVLSPLGSGPPATCTLCWGPFPLTSPTGSTWPGTPTCARHLCLPWSSLCLC